MADTFSRSDLGPIEMDRVGRGCACNNTRTIACKELKEEKGTKKKKSTEFSRAFFAFLQLAGLGRYRDVGSHRRLLSS